MADIALTVPGVLPDEWRVVLKTTAWQLAISENSGPYGVSCRQFGHIQVAVLSHTVRCEEVLDSLRRYGDRFQFVLRQKGHVSGVVWNTSSSDMLVFRDIMGNMPWMVTDGDNGPVALTSSPFLHETMVRGRDCNRTWISRFLQESHDISHDDVFAHTRRILPGECWQYCKPGREWMLLADEAVEGDKQWHVSGYWNRVQYQAMDASYEDLTHGLYTHLMEAAQRIPDRHLCFTLSGGLDSSGIMAAWCRQHPGNRVDACSLVSGIHDACDESPQLDILEKSFPVNLWRVDMDSASVQNDMGLKGQCRAYGPMCASGMGLLLYFYQSVAEHFGPRMIVTGYGGNYLVSVRYEALLGYLLGHLKSSHVREAVLDELGVMKPQVVRRLAGRVVGNVGSGEWKRLYHSVVKREDTWQKYENVRSWMNPLFAAQFPEPQTDLVCGMSHVQERAWRPQTWAWEERMRMLDWMARQTCHTFYDALKDPILWDYCAQIPPYAMLSRGEYRKCYKDALKQILPNEIICHPKCQHFDDTLHDEIGIKGRAQMEAILKRSHEDEVLSRILNLPQLTEVYRDYVDGLSEVRRHINLSKLWRALSLCAWREL